MGPAISAGAGPYRPEQAAAAAAYARAVAPHARVQADAEEFLIDAMIKQEQSLPLSEYSKKSCEDATENYESVCCDLACLSISAHLAPTRLVLYSLASSANPVSAAEERSTREHMRSQLISDIAVRRLRLRRLRERQRRMEVAAAPPTLAPAPDVQQCVWSTLHEFCGVSSSVGAFAAFPGAGALGFLDAVLRGPLVRRSGLAFSAAPAHVLDTPARGLPVSAASLSSGGVLCVGAADGLFVACLATGARAQLRGGNHMFGCVFRDTLYVGWFLAEVLRVAPVAEALAGLPLERFGTLALGATAGRSAALDFARDGWLGLACASEPRAVLLVDLARGTSMRVRTPAPLSYLGGFTGVVPLAYFAVANSGVSSPTRLLDKSGGATEIVTAAGVLGAYPAALPSAARADDLARAAFVDASGSFWHGGAALRFPPPVRPAFGQFLVRLFQDVFLALEDGTGRWFATRIVVP